MLDDVYIPGHGSSLQSRVSNVDPHCLPSFSGETKIVRFRVREPLSQDLLHELHSFQSDSLQSTK